VRLRLDFRPNLVTPEMCRTQLSFHFLRQEKKKSPIDSHCADLTSSPLRTGSLLKTIVLKKTRRIDNFSIAEQRARLEKIVVFYVFISSKSNEQMIIGHP